MNKENCQSCNAPLDSRLEPSGQISRGICEDCIIEQIDSTPKMVVAYKECKSSFLLKLRPAFDNRRLVCQAKSESHE